MSEKKKRRRWAARDKLRVVLPGLDGSVEIARSYAEPLERRLEFATNGGLTRHLWWLH